MEKKGYKPIWITEASHDQLLARLKQAGKGQQQGEWCLTGVIIDGDLDEHTVCLGGRCAWYKRILGGDCVSKVSGSCSCSWGILDPILGLFRN